MLYMIYRIPIIFSTLLEMNALIALKNIGRLHKKNDKDSGNHIINNQTKYQFQIPLSPHLLSCLKKLPTKYFVFHLCDLFYSRFAQKFIQNHHRLLFHYLFAVIN